MPDFVAPIEHHLRRVQRIEAVEVTDADKPLDLLHHEELVADRLDRPSNRFGYGTILSNPVALAHFIDEVHWELLAGFGAHLSHATRRHYIDMALEVMISGEIDVQGISSVQAPQAKRLAKIADTVCFAVRSWAEKR